MPERVRRLEPVQVLGGAVHEGVLAGRFQPDQLAEAVVQAQEAGRKYITVASRVLAGK